MKLLKFLHRKLLLLYYSLPTISFSPPKKDPQARVEERMLFGYSPISSWNDLDYDLMAWLLPRLKLHYYNIEKDTWGVPGGFAKDQWLNTVSDMIYFVENYAANYPEALDQKRIDKGRRDLIRYLDRLWI